MHRYLTVSLDGRRVALDATFPGERWDGRSPLPLACSAGEDYEAGADPDSDKRALEDREPFIAAIAALSGADFRADR